MKTFALALALALGPLATAVVAQAPAPPRIVLPTDRTVLPIPEPAPPAITEVDARKATLPSPLI